MGSNDDGKHEVICSSGTLEVFEQLWHETSFNMAQEEIFTQQQLVQDSQNDKSKLKAEEKANPMEHANAIEQQRHLEFMRQVDDVPSIINVFYHSTRNFMKEPDRNLILHDLFNALFIFTDLVMITNCAHLTGCIVHFGTPVDS
ncbi:hypothetical protein Plhal304r1_c055g0141261 [Plasmopara halstedii]